MHGPEAEPKVPTLMQKFASSLYFYLFMLALIPPTEDINGSKCPLSSLLWLPRLLSQNEEWGGH